MKTGNLLLTWLIAAAMLLAAHACTNTSKKNQDARDSTATKSAEVMETEVKTEKAVCTLYPTEGNNVTGTVTFTKSGEVVKIVADLEGLTPGKHGFHIHENGDCSSPDGTSAGGHFNPTSMKHGAPEDSERHAGDFGNIEADENGKAHLEMTDSQISFTGENSIIGKGIIVHAGEDDFTTQPTGDAGARVACGVIELDKENQQ
jgi:Cu-Zn family superoxide dismutase